ncbi:uncharacterized protein LTR77_005590 [Saxophila tyrrhenica]|uniref:DUF7137 domain-containing protein n=1 Tax=Saxophila tyrrhenica TaxID=1690608 RepID=A0AAV9P913_9PEZI|nr:hypothetical protein LTR77_005590 [Saxophila tyrrhenica]
MRPSSFASSLLLFTAAASAWPWPPSWQPRETGAVARRDTTWAIERRQQSSLALSLSTEQGNTATTEKSTEKSTKKTTKGDDATQSASASATDTKSGDDSKTTGKTTGKSDDDDNKKTTKKTSYETTKTFDNRLPAGGVSMITPNVIAGPQYYKIASKPGQEYITFAWNYTSLSRTPSAIDILASCSQNSATYTISANASVTGPTQEVIWDVGKYQATATQPLLMATYTLVIHDAQADITASPRAGYLGTWNQFYFGMYLPQEYTPIADYVCATCSGAMSSMTRHTIWGMLGMAAVTVLSFGWFGGVAGLW